MGCKASASKTSAHPGRRAISHDENCRHAAWRFRPFAATRIARVKFDQFGRGAESAGGSTVIPPKTLKTVNLAGMRHCRRCADVLAAEGCSQARRSPCGRTETLACRRWLQKVPWSTPSAAGLIDPFKRWTTMRRCCAEDLAGKNQARTGPRRTSQPNLEWTVGDKD